MTERQLGTLDFETDPFRRGMKVAPFVAGLFDGAEFRQFWGDNCVEQLVSLLHDCKTPLLLYAHNGGRFDFLFMLREIEDKVTVINGRIVKAKLGIHELRDSFAILPVPLRQAGDKGEISYSLMRRGVRDRHRLEILKYLERDCRELYGAVEAYRERFGNKLTMAGAAFSKLEDAIAQATGKDPQDVLQRLRLDGGDSPDNDPFFRKWFYGGRVQCFEKGVLTDDFKAYDVNSMYPYVMREFEHPTGGTMLAMRAIDDRTDFATIEGTSDAALPVRGKHGGLSFPRDSGTFHATGHEIRAGVSLGTLKIHRLIAAYRSPVRTSFREFVDEYYALRQEADRKGDKTGKLHFKLVLNSSYGRFALRPDKLREWLCIPRGYFPEDGTGWNLSYLSDHVGFWSRPAALPAQYRAIRNVATAASITGAARAVLMRAIAEADRPIYCDTDSIVCRSLNVELDALRLGAWKLEVEADRAAIAGKKLYALWNGRKCVKHACKGVQLTPKQILAVAQGASVTWRSQAPVIDLAGVQNTRFARTVRMTA